jgi:hypothetical protein
MKRLIWLPLAGFLLVAGAAVAAASPAIVETAAALVGQATGPTSTSSPSPDGTDGSEDANDDSDAKPDGGATHGHAFGFGLEPGAPGELLDDTLADLVANGTITQTQADAITDAVARAIEDNQAELDGMREQMEQTWQQVQSFLEDGVITSDELSQLAEDNPISNLEDILADGQITQEELDSVMVGPHFMRGPGGPGYFHVQRVPGGPGQDDAQPDSGSDTSDNS